VSFYADFAEHYERIFPLREETFAFLAQALPAGGKRVLDVGCGTGHYCGRFAAAGLEALGIDLDPAMIAAARARYPAASFDRLDMRAIGTLSGRFDLVFCIGNTLAHLPQDELPGFLGAVRGLLAARGRWLLQVVHWDRILAEGAAELPVLRHGDGVAFHRRYLDLSPRRARFVTRLEEEGVERFRGEVDLYPLGAARYEELHAAAGLAVVGRHGDFRGSPYGPGSPACVLVFERETQARAPGDARGPLSLRGA